MLSGEGKDVNLLRQLGGWLRSSHSFKECVIAHSSSVIAPRMVGIKRPAEAWPAYASMRGRGAFSEHRSDRGNRCRGVRRSEDAGMSTRKSV